MGLCHRNANESLWKHVLEHPHQKKTQSEWIIRELAEWYDIPNGLITYLLDHHRFSREVAGLLASQKSADERQLVRFATEFASTEVFVALAGRKDAREHPEIRPLLLKSRSPAVAEALIAHTESDEFAPTFRKLARHNPEAASEALEERDSAPGLGTTDLAPLLEGDEETRLRAIRLLGTMRKAQEAREREAKQERGTRRRR